MKVEYLPSFLKDLKALKSAPVFEQVKAIVFVEIPNVTDLQTIINLKKLKGDDNAYRLPVGDYRIGFYFDGETITFVRALHRKDIYSYFPPYNLFSRYLELAYVRSPFPPSASIVARASRL